MRCCISCRCSFSTERCSISCRHSVSNARCSTFHLLQTFRQYRVMFRILSLADVPSVPRYVPCSISCTHSISTARCSMFHVPFLADVPSVPLDVPCSTFRFSQTFRQYREMFEEQKSVIEQRYRGLLEEAIDDAVFLSSRNTELSQESLAVKQGQLPPTQTRSTPADPN